MGRKRTICATWEFLSTVSFMLRLKYSHFWKGRDVVGIETLDSIVSFQNYALEARNAKHIGCPALRHRGKKSGIRERYCFFHTSTKVVIFGKAET